MQSAWAKARAARIAFAAECGIQNNVFIKDADSRSGLNNKNDAVSPAPINESAFRTVQSLRSAIGTTRTAEPERSRDNPARLALILVPQEQRNSESAEIKMKKPAASGVGLNAASVAETSITPAQKAENRI